MEYNLLAKSRGPVFKQTLNPCAHVSAIKQRRSNLVDHRVGLADGTIQIGSHDLFSDCKSESRPAGKSLGKGRGLRVKLFIGNNAVHDVPAFEGRGVILVGGVDDLSRPTRPGPLCQTLDAAQQGGGPNRRFDLAKAG